MKLERSEILPAEVQKAFVKGNLPQSQRLAEDFLKSSRDHGLLRQRVSFELARVYLYEGQLDQAAFLLESTLEPALNPDLEAERLLLLATIENQRGHSIASDVLIGRVEQLSTSSASTSALLATKGSIALARGNLNAAEQFLTAALKQDFENHSEFQASQMSLNLGVVALQRERFEESIFLFQRALGTADKIGAALIKEKALGSLSWAYCQTGDFSRSITAARDAEKQADALGAEPDKIQILINEGNCLVRGGDLMQARTIFESALQLSRKSQNSEKLFRSNVALSYLSLRSNISEAVVHIDEAKSLVKDSPDSDDKYEQMLLECLLALKESSFHNAEHGLLLIVAHSNAAPSLRWEAENTLADLYDKTDRPREAEHWYRRSIATFHQQRLTLKSVELELPFLENGSDLYMGYMEHLIRAGRTGEALGLLDASRAETLAEGLGFEAGTMEKSGKSGRSGVSEDPRAMAARLHATVLVYCLRPERSYLWAVTGKERRFYTLPGSGTILPLVARHNEEILAAKDLLSQKESTGRALYDALLAPAAGGLPKNGGRVVLVADSALSRLNFETLIAPGDPTKGTSPHYWVEDVSVTNARSLRLLAAGAESRPMKPKLNPDAPKMLLIGDPVYPKGEYAPLPNAGAEMAGIAGHFAPAERVVESGAEASPVSYKANRPQRFRFLHFVAHATASELNPLDSAVILSKPSRDDSGAAEIGTETGNKLYASDIMKQPLSAELVTLSSCYSSGMRNYAGEGVVGLAWAFLRAGAHSVIGALWEVSDVSTPRLMDTLYTRLLAGNAPDAALRTAKLEMLRSDGVFRKPVYWGAFQLYAGR